jgi:galactonate dehydratase
LGRTSHRRKSPYRTNGVEELMDFLLGKDPLRIEDHWQVMYRAGFYRGGSILMSAIAGIDQALWDIKGKYYNTPVY